MKTNMLLISSVPAPLCLILAILLSTATPNQASRFVEGINDFSINMFDTVAISSKARLQNIITAPFVVQTSLAGMAEFLDPVPKSALLEILQMDIVNNIAIKFHTLYKNLSMDHALSMVNAQYCSVGYKIQPAYLKNMTSTFSQAIFTDIDFTKHNITGPEIDKYVADQTKNQITTVVLPKDLDANTDLAIVTAASFDGTLLKPFSPFLTKREVFNVQIWNPNVTTSSSSSSSSSFAPIKPTDVIASTVRTNCVHSQGHFRLGFVELLGADVLEIPYKNPLYNLLILLPREMFGIYNLQTALKQNGDITFIRNQLKYQQVSVQIPKFSIALNIELAEIISKMGDSYLFHTTNLDQIAVPEKGNTPLRLSDVIHKSQIIFTDSDDFSQPEPIWNIPKGVTLPTFIADHPFVFIVIRENTIIEIGRIFNPYS